MNALLEKVEIFKEKQKDGRWVKSVQFKIPLNVEGKLVDTMFFDDDEDTENSLSNEKYVETACLLSRKDKYRKVAYFQDFCEVSIIREALWKARFSCMETYLLCSSTGEKVDDRKNAVGFSLWIRCHRLWHWDRCYLGCKLNLSE